MGKILGPDRDQYPLGLAQIAQREGVNLVRYRNLFGALGIIQHPNFILANEPPSQNALQDAAAHLSYTYNGQLHANECIKLEYSLPIGSFYRYTPLMVLALDTATPYLVLGLPYAERALRLQRRHAELLWPELQSFLHDSGVVNSGLKAIVVGRGPGSYTGLRVGIAAALGLARGLGIPVVGVDTLEAVAMKYTGPVTVAHGTRNGLCYCARYLLGASKREIFAHPHRAKLDGLEVHGIFSLDEPPSGMALAQLGLEAIQAGKHRIEALYL